ncbi:MAG: PEGA domain-containing protein [Methanomicrobiaceae archaeon]|uniref:PEGA domain-containing protein n=1 Tax=Methanoculleus sp. TaxID=90427 RepID=UPI0032116C2F|nr:PEGA domain-containing protein [Methanomicrobiaceae archaeon]
MDYMNPVIRAGNIRETVAMKTGLNMHPAGWRETIVVFALLVALIAAPAAAADFGGITLPDYKHIDIQMANGGEKYIKFDGGGLNALHITTDPSEPYGQVTETSAQSGTFYFSDTGGRGFFDDLILMVAVQGQIPDGFKVHVRASGYQWTPTPVLNQPPTMEEITYSEGFTDRTFTRSDFIYEPQIWKPGKENYPIYHGQDMSRNNPEDRFYIMFIDLGVGAIGPNSFLDGLTDNGCAKIEYSFENLETFAALNAYGWCNQSNQGKGISWSNDLTGFSETGISGYSVQGTRKGGDTAGSGGGSGSSGGGTSTSGESSIRGSSLNTPVVGSINGTLYTFTAPGPTEPLATGTSSSIRVPVTLPEGTRIDRALLYVYVSDAKETETGTGTEVTPGFKFDGKPIAPTAVSRDRQGTGTAPMVGTFTLEVPPEMLAGGDHTLTVRTEGEQKVTYRVPAALLVLVINDPTRPRIDYWIAEGCDDVLADLWEGTTGEDAITEVKFDGTLEQDQASGARLYVVSTAAPDQGGTGNRVTMNTWEWLNPLQQGPPGVWTAVLDVLPFIQELGNIAEVQSYPIGTAGDHLQNRNAILVIQYGAAEGASSGIEISSGGRRAAEEDIGSFVLPYAATGALEEELRYTTGDGNLALTFPNGSRATNGTGAAVTSVTIRAVRDLLPAPRTAMERVYRIAPEDATTGVPFSMTAHLREETILGATWYHYDASVSAWQQINTSIDLTNGTVTAYPEAFGTYGVATPLPATLTVGSNPAGARIFLDGVYLGKVTPATISPAAPGNHTLRLELEQFTSYETGVTIPGDTAVFADLNHDGFPGLNRQKFDEPQMEPGQDRTGGVYVTSRPSGASIIIDGKRMKFVTPHVIQGIREGSHTVQVVKEGQSFNTPTKTVWVERDCITPVQIDAHDQAIVRKVSLASDEYLGKGCTLNGRGPLFRLPRTIEVAGANSFITISDGDRYLAHRITPTENGETIAIAPRDATFCGLLVESSPAGAEILVDGFRTGFCTPYLIRNVSDGPHVIAVTRPGYQPAEEEVWLTDDKNADIDKRLTFRLEPYSYGSLNVTSEPAGAQIYIYNKNTGEVTPHTFRYMPIGTYEIKVVGNTTFRTADDITIRPYAVTGRTFNLI